MKIDFVVTWVDSTDSIWACEKRKWKGEESKPEDDVRYRNWDLFRFWFRAVEKYAPWVNKVFLVTYGHYPKWLNLNHPQLRLVKHEEFIPKEYLPTFRSDTIEFNVHRIPDLSEHFVLFNDDMFINQPITPDYYFRNGLPCDLPSEIVPVLDYVKNDGWGIQINEVCNIAMINRHFNHREVVKGNWLKWYAKHDIYKSFKERIWYYLNVFPIFILTRHFLALHTPHNERPFLKDTFRDAWEKEYEMIDLSCRCKFRKPDSVSIYLIRYWQLVSNRFSPKMHSDAKCFNLSEKNLDYAINAIRNPKIKSVCLNDTPRCSLDFLECAKKRLIIEFEKKLPEKSSYEV